MFRVSITLLLLLFTASPAAAELAWKQLPPLPDEFGFGGPAAGEHNGALIVAGGANFPNGAPWAGGEKVWHDNIYVLEKSVAGNAKNQWREAGVLPRRIAYGVSISTDDGMLLIGGEVDGEAIADVYRLKWNGDSNKVEIKSLPSLPQPASYIAGGKIGSKIFILGARRSADANRLDEKLFWSFDLNKFAQDATTTWELVDPSYPGSPRHKAVVAVQSMGSGAENLFLISGSNPRFAPDGTPDLAKFENFTDAYRYDPQENRWSPIADLPALPDSRDLPGQEPFSKDRWPVAAGVGVGVGQSHVLVFSGSTGRYITLPVEERPLFSNYVLGYHTITNEWAVVGEMPVGVVTTSITRWGEDYVIPSGEIKPGVRTNKVQSLSIKSFTADFGSVNYGILIVYLLSMLMIGGFFALRTTSTDDFFRGGQRVPYWVAGVSIFATMLSSITFVALPAKAYATDWVYYVAQLTIIPIAFVVVLIAIPFFRYIDATSAYEYLEKRFSYFVRIIASLQFVLFQLARMAIVMYLPALALAAITPLSVMQCVVVMGILSVVYCTLGGVEAVVWTDAVQTIVLMGGLLVALLVVVVHTEGGAAAAFETAYDDGKLHLANVDFSWGSWATTSVWVVFVGQFFGSLYSYTSDQAVVQRYLTTKDEADACKAMWTTAWMGVFGSILFFAMGSALYVFYKSNPSLLDVGMRNDSIFPLFIATELPVGVAGLVVAGIFAAAQSTISTSMNSTATSIVTDFCVPFEVCKTDTGYLRLARTITALLGIAGTVLGCWLVQVGSAMAIDAFISVIGLFGGAVCGLFMLGILTRRANAMGSLVGSVCGFATVLWVVLDKSIHVHEFSYAAIGTVVTFVVGYLVSLLTGPPRQEDLLGLTVYDRVVIPHLPS